MEEALENLADKRRQKDAADRDARLTGKPVRVKKAAPLRKKLTSEQAAKMSADLEGYDSRIQGGRLTGGGA